jgi:hypothetical protein
LLRTKDDYGQYPWQRFRILNTFFQGDAYNLEKRTFLIEKYVPLPFYWPKEEVFRTWGDIIFAAQLPTLRNEISNAIIANFENIKKLNEEITEQTEKLEKQEKERQSKLEQGIPVDTYRPEIIVNNFKKAKPWMFSKIEMQLAFVLKHRAWLDDANQTCVELSKYIENLN